MGRVNVRPELRALPAYRFQPYPATVKLDQNESPEDLPEPLRSTALGRLRDASWNRYPDLHPDGLAERLGDRHGWPAEGVVVAGGSNVLIQALVIASGLGRRVVGLAPSFPLYELQARLLGAAFVAVPLGPGFAFPVDAVAAAMATDEGVGFVPSPMAPTGNAVAAADLAYVAGAVGPGWTLVIDEAYAEFAGGDAGAVAADHPNVVRLRTLSKAFGLAGARIGYALAHPAYATELRKALLPFSVSALQSAVAEAALDAPQVVEERVRRTVAERERMADALRTMGATVHPSATNFLLLTVTDAAAAHAGLLAHGVLVRRQDHLPSLAGAVRVSIGTAEENDRFLAAFAALPPHVGRAA